MGCDSKAVCKEDTLPKFQSTHPAWGATYSSSRMPSRTGISIHAPRMGCDPQRLQVAVSTPAISIHAPRMGCDRDDRDQAQRQRNFNPRTPHGVRPLPARSSPSRAHFNPRTPHGVRQYRPCAAGDGRSDFNPRTPHGVRPRSICRREIMRGFQSTHPAWGATRYDGSIDKS